MSSNVEIITQSFQMHYQQDLINWFLQVGQVLTWDENLFALCSANKTIGIHMWRKLLVHDYEIAGGKDFWN